jgi:divalent metal cation (Fe/Co/Zn/Cd) transporter
VGREIFLDLHILVDPELRITQAHDIAENLENEIAECLSCPVNITIHVEPDLPELRV